MFRKIFLRKKNRLNIKGEYYKQNKKRGEKKTF